MGLGDVNVLTAMERDAKFIAELFQTDQWPPTLAIADSRFSRQYNIFAFSVAPLITEETDPTNYWIEWGGTFDNPVGFGLQLFMNVFLTEVFLPENLELTDNSFWIDTVNNICYMNTVLHPWQYFRAFASVYGNFLSSFSTAPKNEDNPSDIFYGGVQVRPVMSIPKLENKLNNIISGINVYNSFELSVNNSDGFYDSLDILAFFNTPLQISKNTNGGQTLEHFDRIRYGIVNDIKLGFDMMSIEATDQFFLMNRPVCRKTTVDEFPNIEDGELNKDIPVAWGLIQGIEPIEVGKDTAGPPTWIDYIVIDKDYITSVQGVFDEYGNSLTYTFNATTGVIRVTELGGDGEVIEAEYINATGKTDNSIGEIIIDILGSNENIAYIEGIWDLEETDYYLTICPDIGLFFDGGTTRELIEKTLRNDNAFLIQKNDGLLTLRRWGENYTTHQIPSWLITKKPQKNFEDATKFYCSSARIFYKPFQSGDNFQLIYRDNSRDRELFERYRKRYEADFETDLLNETDSTDLASRILERFGKVRETLKVGLGVNTFEVNPLDTIELDMTINDRQFSEYNSFIVKSVDPGQDEIEMEGLEIQYLLTLDDEIATLDNTDWYVSGIL